MRASPVAALVPLLALAGGAAGMPQRAHAGEVTVAVAANFAVPLQRIAQQFTAATGHVVRASAGATGKLYTQIALGGAPFEVLLAADAERPARLEAEGHAVAGTRFTYAIGQLVLWSARPGLVDAQGAVLAMDRQARLAIANPKTAPYGLAAMEVLARQGVAPAWAARQVTADSIAQAYQWVASGQVDLGFVALSQVQAASTGGVMPGSMWRVPPALHGELRQDAVLLKAGAANPAARALLDFLKSAPARELIAAAGYRVPGER